METIKMLCPNCGAVMAVEEGAAMHCCQKCYTLIYIDESVKRVEEDQPEQSAEEKHLPAPKAKEQSQKLLVYHFTVPACSNKDKSPGKTIRKELAAEKPITDTADQDDDEWNVPQKIWTVIWLLLLAAFIIGYLIHLDWGAFSIWSLLKLLFFLSLTFPSNAYELIFDEKPHDELEKGRMTKLEKALFARLTITMMIFGVAIAPIGVLELLFNETVPALILLAAAVGFIFISYLLKKLDL